MSDPWELYDNISKERKSKLCFKEFCNYHFYGGPNGEMSSDEQRQALARDFREHLNSIEEDDDLYYSLRDFCDYPRWMADELNKFRDHKRISKELEAQKKETSNAYRLMFFVLILGCVLGEIRGRFF